MSISNTQGANTPPLLVNGLVSGINTQQVIQALLQSYLAPVNNLKAQQSNLNTQANDWQTINSDVASFETTATGLSYPSGWGVMAASSSNSNVATGSVTNGAQAGTVSFVVNTLAAANTLISSGTLASTSTQAVNPAVSPTYLLSQNASSLGFSTLTAGNTLAAGHYTVGVAGNPGGPWTVTVTNTDNNTTANTVINAGFMAGQSVALNAPGGAQITAVYSGASLTDGTVKATNVSTGDGSLAAVVSAINNANAGITASAVKDASGYLLLMSSTTTGSASNISSNLNTFNGSALGNLVTATAGTDADIQIGGLAGPHVTSTSNNITGLLPGLTVSLASTSASPVTITVNPDGKTAASNVQGLVTAANKVLSDIQQFGSYNTTTKQAGPLFGSIQLQELQSSILSTFSNTLGTSTLGGPLAVGIGISTNSGSNLQLTFNAAKFAAAYNANPTQVQNLFTTGGTFKESAPQYAGGVSLVYAGFATKAGSYAVNITESATEAAVVGSMTNAGSFAANETLNFSQGSLHATYIAQMGESAAQFVADLNSLFATNGLNLQAAFNGLGNITVSSTAYGSGGNFVITSAGLEQTGLPGSYVGNDVAGTIGGQAANGNGQILTSASSSAPLGGLSLLVSVPGINGPAVNIGSFKYSPGVAQVGQVVADQYSNPINGLLTTQVQSAQHQSSGLNTQITFYQNLANQEQTMLQKEFAQLEATLGQLKGESQALTGQIAQLPGTGTGH